MASRKFQEQLAAMDKLRLEGSPTATDELRNALRNRNNYIVAKAAKAAAQLALDVLVPDLRTALDRFFVDPVKSDPQCWAKHALVQALADLGCDDSNVY